jgi:hypothetical protein
LRGLQDLRADMQAAREELQFDISKAPALQAALDELEGRILHGDRGLFSSLALYLDFASSIGRNRKVLLHYVERAIRVRDARQSRRIQRLVGQYLTTYLQRLSRAAGFRFYERLFALWHVFHVPLLFLLIAATTVHVIAVHLY